MSILTSRALGVAGLRTASLGLASRDWWGGGGGAPAEWSLVGVGYVETFWWHDEQGTAWDYDIPAETLEGDLMITFHGGRSNAVWTPPAGYGAAWFSGGAGGNSATAGYYRYAGAAEGGTSEAWDTSSQDRQQVGFQLVIRGGVVTGDPLDTAITVDDSYDNVVQVPAITTASAGVFLLNLWGKRWNAGAVTEDTLYPGNGWTGIAMRYLNPSCAGAAYKVIDSAGVVAAENWGALPAGETNNWYSHAIALKAG